MCPFLALIIEFFYCIKYTLHLCNELIHLSLLKGVACYNGTKVSDELKGRLLESTLSKFVHAKLDRYVRQKRIIAMMV